MLTPRSTNAISLKVPSVRTAALVASAAMAGMALAVSAPASAHHHKAAPAAEAPVATPNIVETAQSTGVHTTLVAAVSAAGLADTLASGGPFTVFAPTDAAFAQLPEGTVAELVKPENKETLTAILTYHAVSGNITAEMILGLIAESETGVARIQTLAGGVLEARLSGETVVVTDGAGRTSAVTTADVMTSNGVIHVTDGVFLPG